VRSLLGLLDEVPSELLTLPFNGYLEFTRCRAALASALPSWELQNTGALPWVNGKNPVARIRRLLQECPDEPRTEPQFPFMTDDNVRLGIEDRLRGAWTNFRASEWFSATVCAGNALEALLLWRLKEVTVAQSSNRLNRMKLEDLINFASDQHLIGNATAQQAHLARDARDLVHPGRVARTGTECSRATALAALAAAYQVAEEFRRTFANPDQK
jgi:hypothetical protein